MQLALEVITHSMNGEVFTFQPGDVRRIGRTEPSDLSFPDDPQISGKHFALEFKNGKWVVDDLGSTNGTFVNSRRVRDAILQDGDEIAAGQTRFNVRLSAAAAHSIGTPSTSGTSTPTFNHEPAVGDADKSSYTWEPGDGRDVLCISNESPFSVATMLGEVGAGQAYLTVVLKATFTVDHNGKIALASEQLPVFDADILEDPQDPASPVRFESDMVPFKPRADVVLVGRACAPDRRPVKQLDVRLRVGILDKTIRVFGDRKWHFPTRLALTPRISGPEPFQEMELTYRRAFGGIDPASAKYCLENLAGVGYVGGRAPESMHGKPLPNLEDPNNLINAWDSRPMPVGFGFFGRGWMPRLRYTGAFDMTDRMRLAPEDYSLEFYNGGHPHLQIEGYLQGGEAVELHSVHPDGPLYFGLPTLRPEVAVTRIVSSDLASRASTAGPKTVGDQLYAFNSEPHRFPVLDTLVLIPNHRTFYEVFRCVVPVHNLDRIDVHNVAIMPSMQ